MWSGIYQSPTSPFYFVYSNQGGMALVPLSYASASGAARICQPRVKAMEQNNRAGGECERGFPPPTVRRYLFIYLFIAT